MKPLKAPIPLPAPMTGWTWSGRRGSRFALFLLLLGAGSVVLAHTSDETLAMWRQWGGPSGEFRAPTQNLSVNWPNGGPDVADAVSRWREAGENAGVRRKGDGGRGVGALEEGSFAGEAQEVRCLGVGVAIGLQVIGPSRIKSDEDERRRIVLGGRHRREGERQNPEEMPGVDVDH